MHHDIENAVCLQHSFPRRDGDVLAIADGEMLRHLQMHIDKDKISRFTRFQLM